MSSQAGNPWGLLGSPCTSRFSHLSIRKGSVVCSCSMFCSLSLASEHPAPQESPMCACTCLLCSGQSIQRTSFTRYITDTWSHSSPPAGAVCLTPDLLWDGCWGPGAGLTGGKCWGQQPCPRKGTWRLAKSKAIPSLSCGGEDGLSVVCVSFGTGVEGESRWLSVALQASVRAKTRTRFLKSQAPSSVS